MPETPKPTTLELGLYARENPSRRITGIEIGAGVLTCLWLVAVIFVNTRDPGGEGSALADGVLTTLAVLMPIALIWVAATAARTARGLREEAARLQASIDAMRAAYIDQQQRATMDLRPAVVEKLEELVETTRAAQAGAGACFRRCARCHRPQTARRSCMPRPHPTCRNPALRCPHRQRKIRFR